MNSSFKRIYRLTTLLTATAFLFFLFFQVNKGGPFREINPFGNDPYDAIGSFAFQIALFVGILTFARALRLQFDPAQPARLRLILRGNFLAWSVITVVLVGDGIAVILSPLPQTFWGDVLLAELIFMALLAALCGVGLVYVQGQVPSPPPPAAQTPADGIDDLLALVQVPVKLLGRFLPRPLTQWVQGLSSDRLFSRAAPINPRLHPWRFAFAIALLAGVGLALAQLREGLPPNFQVGLLVSGIFILGELCAILVGYATLGAYLGLRPGSSKTRQA